MPNIASLLKEEITRLARKELKKELEGLKKASALHRSEIAALKRSVATLQKQASRHAKRSGPQAASEAAPESETPLRFSAKGLVSQRRRLGLSAADFGRLLEVSAQTIYNWETGKTKPRRSQLVAITGVKKLGKKQARATLAAMAG